MVQGESAVPTENLPLLSDPLSGPEPESAGQPDAPPTLRAERTRIRRREAYGVRVLTPRFSDSVHGELLGAAYRGWQSRALAGGVRWGGLKPGRRTAHAAAAAGDKSAARLPVRRRTDWSRRTSPASPPAPAHRSIATPPAASTRAAPSPVAWRFPDARAPVKTTPGRPWSPPTVSVVVFVLPKGSPFYPSKTAPAVATAISSPCCLGSTISNGGSTRIRPGPLVTRVSG